MSNHKWKFSFDNDSIKTISLEVEIESIGIRTSNMQIAMKILADVAENHTTTSKCCKRGSTPSE